MLLFFGFDLKKVQIIEFKCKAQNQKYSLKAIFCFKADIEAIVPCTNIGSNMDRFRATSFSNSSYIAEVFSLTTF